MNVWPQFRSPLIWDVFAVSTYGTISLLFWFVGLIPDFGTMRDEAKSPFAQKVYGLLSMGWRGSARHWKRYESAYLLLAGLATPLVLSVHTVVSFDFAVSVIPGWHTTIFPPYFVAGAIYSGFAMVLVLAIPIRRFYGLRDMITERHLDNAAKVMLATGLIVAYGYTMEAFFAFYSGNPYEKFMFLNRAFGPYGWSYWLLVATNIVIPQLLWIRRVRLNTVLLFLLSIDILIGMWFERFVIVVTSLHRDFLPSSWGMYVPTRWDLATYAGTVTFFFFLFLLFIRVMPMISIFEMRTLLPESKVKEEVAAHD
jgi:molybdopterin-containing oxidoreductase family membrane subunit